MATSPAVSPARPKTGIRVIVVGTGFGGLTAAIECHRHGHDVVVVEKYAQRKELGDIISFGQNASRVFRKWPGVGEQFEQLSHRADSLQLRTWEGEPLVRQYWTQEVQDWGVRYDGHRGELHGVLYRHAVEELGIDIRLGHRVVEYFETDAGAGVVVEVVKAGEEDEKKTNGSSSSSISSSSSSSSSSSRADKLHLEADVVLAADGVRSTGRTLVLGYEDRPQASGYAVYRAWFDGREALAQDPLTAWLFDRPEGDQHVCWIGPDVHVIVASLVGTGSFSWVCTHKDEADIAESWQLQAPVAEARRVLQSWDPVVQRLLDLTPEPLVDWKLVYRDPLPTWISPRRRIALLGDAAHPFLPTSIQGASQAVEDGVTLAVVLRRAAEAAEAAEAARGDGRGVAATGNAATTAAAVPEALAAFEALRYERVRAAQKTGERTRDTWHQADMKKARANPDSMRLRRDGWLLGHDAEAYAEDNYDTTIALLRRSAPGDTTAARQLNKPELPADLL